MRISDWSSDVCSSDLIFHDNLLDASHLSYVHLGSLDNGGIAAAKYKIEEEGQSIFLRREEPGVCYEEPLASFFGCKPGLKYNRVHTTEAYMPSIHIAKPWKIGRAHV